MLLRSKSGQAALLALAFAAAPFAKAQWSPAVTNSTASLRGIHDVGAGTVWASGTNGTVLRSEDEGYVWQQCSVPPGAEKLDFRGIFGWDANHAVVMSSGTGTASRLYETTDGCTSWHLIFENPDRAGFWDGITFRGKTGVLVGDPTDGRFVLYRSDDGGHHWRRDGNAGLAAKPKGEGLFAASNSSLAMLRNGDLCIGTGGLGGPRVLRLHNGHWSSVKVPLAAGKDSAGVFSLAFRDDTHGIAVGGDYKMPSQTAGTAAWTSDGGQTWHAANSPPPGYRSSAGWDAKLKAWVAVGSNGGDLSLDDGHTWRPLDAAAWNALSLPWVAGPNGRIASLDLASLAVAKAMGAKSK